MTTPASPNPISFLDLQNEFGGTNPISLDEYYLGSSFVNSNVPDIPGSGTISLSNFRGKSSIIASYRLITTSGTYTLPATSGTRIFVLAVAGGGGGGGGNGRTYAAGGVWGGGGGGSGGIGYGWFDTVSAGAQVVVTIGAGGGGGSARDGVYVNSNPGSNGANGTATTVKYGGVNVLSPGPGAGGIQSPGSGTPTGSKVKFSKGGAGGTSSYSNVGTGAQNYWTSAKGADVTSGNQLGAVGARGLIIKTDGTKVNIMSPTWSGIGTNGTYGVDGVVYSAKAPIPGTGSGGGGSGGGCTQSDVERNLNARINGCAGNAGAVLLWWGR